MTSQKLALEATGIAEEKKARGIVLLDICGICIMSDYFLICNGESQVHMRAIAKELEEKLCKEGVSLFNTGDYLNDRWILLDFGGVVVHIFSPEARDYYQLERIWADAKKKYIGDFSGIRKKIDLEGA